VDSTERAVAAVAAVVEAEAVAEVVTAAIGVVKVEMAALLELAASRAHRRARPKGPCSSSAAAVTKDHSLPMCHLRPFGQLCE
jgi:hypothetical protein